MSYTVTAAQSGGNTFNGIALTVKVLTGAAATQNGQTAGSDSVTTPDLAITPNATGSWVYGALVNDVASPAYTPGAATTFTQNVTDATNGAVYGTFRSTATTTGGTPVTLGATAPTPLHTAITLAEILASGTLAEDASSPAVISTTAATTVTTASFTPPAGSLLVAVVSSNFSGWAASTVTVTSTGSPSLAWTRQAADGFGLTSVWIAQVPGAAAGAPQPLVVPSLAAIQAASW